MSNTVVPSELTQDCVFVVHFFSLLLLCVTSGTQPGSLSMCIIVVPLLTHTHDWQQCGRDEGQWRGDANEHAQY